MENCAFCQIIEKKAPAYIVYEDGRFMAFLDTQPRTRGHSLVVPREHYRWVDDVPDFGDYFAVAGAVGRAIRRAFQPRTNQYITIGEIVSHAHIHVIPRYANDRHGGTVDFGVSERFSQGEMEAIAEAIRREIEGRG